MAFRPIDVVLIGGPSNATGQGCVRNLPATFISTANVRLWHSSVLNGGPDTVNRWRAFGPAGESPDRFGVKLSLGTALPKRLPRRDWVLIKHGRSDSELHTL